MYRNFFGLTEKPFTITPNPRFIFLSKNHKEVFAHLLYGIRNHCGFIEVTGEVGTGKTTVLRTLLNQLEDDAYRLAFIFNPSLSAPELLRSINREYGISCDGATNDELLSALNAFLLRENAEGRTVVLVIDEAQNLEPAVLEQIRLLSNLETETDKLIQIILVGQPELGQVLAQPELRQLSQRITVRYHLRSMDFEDTRAYMEHRLEVAGGKGSIFTPQAVKRIYRYSGGLPRLINILCDRALLIGYAEEARGISAAMVTTAIRELRRQTKPGKGFRRFWPAVLCTILALSALGGYLTLSPGPEPSASFSPVDAVAPVALETLHRELGELDEEETTAKAFNALAGLWDIEPLAAGQSLVGPAGLKEAAGDRGLRLTPFRGSLETLLSLDAPALLELSLPGASGLRYLALTGVADGRAVIAPALKNRPWLGLAALRSVWSGRAYLLWKNYQGLPYLTVPGTAGEEVARLQNLLRGAGVYDGEPTGVYDHATIAAVTRFQARRGIAQDGRVGPQTLLVLYQAAGSFAPPRMSAMAMGGGA